MPYTYILKCNDGTFYTGSTWNLKKRFDEHENGNGSNYTKKRLPVRLVYHEEFDRIGKAFRREKQIQNWGHKKKEALIRGEMKTLKKKSRKRFKGRLDTKMLFPE